MTDQFDALAREQLLAEDAERLNARVRERACKLRGEAQRVAGTIFPNDPAECRALLDTLIARRQEIRERQAAAKQNPFQTLSAADEELHDLAWKIEELTKRARRTAA